MINRLVDLIRLRAAADTVNTADTALQPVQRVRPVAPVVDRDLELGAVVRAQVMTTLPRGMFEVNVQGRPFVLRLPYEAEPGDQLRLIVTAREPQLKFALAEGPDGNVISTRISETAHFVTTLLGRGDKLPLAEHAPLRTPLISGPALDGTEIGVSLKRALAHSGIFYEAHQAEWVAGSRPLAELLNEPQARLRPLPESSEGQPRDARSARSEPVHPDALAIVKQQLDTLDTRHLAWSGMVWEGQAMYWEISEQSQREKRSPEEPHWQTSLRMNLPQLGAVSAMLGITPRGVVITLRAESAATVATMNEHSAALRQALSGAGVTALDIVVRKHDEA